MSTSLLQKSLKLFEDEGKSQTKGVGRNIQKHNKKKKQLLALNQQKKELIENNIENNLKAIELLNHYSVSKKVSNQIINHTLKADIPLEEKRQEQGTVFTEEDFKAFEEEYADD